MTEVESLYRTHAGFVWRNARRLGCDDALAEDVVHEVFLVVAHRLADFRHEANVRTWLFAITYRAVQRIMRDRARHARRMRDYAQARTAEVSGWPGDPSEAGQYIRVLLGQLDECKRIVFILSELEGMTSAEIGQTLGLNPRTVDSRLRAARTRLLRLIERDRIQQRRYRS